MDMKLEVHTRTHANLANITHDEVLDEVVLSKTELLQHCTSVDTFAFPFGAYDERSVDAIKIANYSGACTTVLGANDRWLDKYLLQRRYVHNSTTAEEVWQWIATAHEQNEWLILCIHDVSLVATQENVSVVVIEEILKAAEYYSLHIMTVHAGLQQISE